MLAKLFCRHIFFQKVSYMILETRYLPVGSLPYETIKSVTAMEAKLYSKCPFIAVLPAISPDENIEKWTFANLPGVSYNDNSLVLKTGSHDYKDKVLMHSRAFGNPNAENLEQYAFEPAFLEKFFQMIKKFKSPVAYINLLGPFTISQILSKVVKEQVITDKNYKKLYFEAVCIKALWIINKMKDFCKNTVPVIILEEPMLGQFGMIKRQHDEITSDFVIELYERVVKKLKSAGAVVGVQCMDKCDWSLPIRGGVDLISYDAYNNPNNLCIIPDIITSFLERGGVINWGIIPVTSESMVKNLTIEYMSNRLAFSMQGLVLSGVPEILVQNSAMVSMNGSTDHLSIFFAEKAIILSTQLSLRLDSIFNVKGKFPIINHNSISNKGMRH